MLKRDVTEGSWKNVCLDKYVGVLNNLRKACDENYPGQLPAVYSAFRCLPRIRSQAPDFLERIESSCLRALVFGLLDNSSNGNVFEDVRVEVDLLLTLAGDCYPSLKPSQLGENYGEFRNLVNSGQAETDVLEAAAWNVLKQEQQLAVHRVDYMLARSGLYDRGEVMKFVRSMTNALFSSKLRSARRALPAKTLCDLVDQLLLRRVVLELVLEDAEVEQLGSFLRRLQFEHVSTTVSSLKTIFADGITPWGNANFDTLVKKQGWQLISDFSLFLLQHCAAEFSVGNRSDFVKWFVEAEIQLWKQKQRTITQTMQLMVSRCNLMLYQQLFRRLLESFENEAKSRGSQALGKFKLQLFSSAVSERAKATALAILEENREKAVENLKAICLVLQVVEKLFVCSPEGLLQLRLAAFSLEPSKEALEAVKDVVGEVSSSNVAVEGSDHDYCSNSNLSVTDDFTAAATELEEELDQMSHGEKRITFWGKLKTLLGDRRGELGGVLELLTHPALVEKRSWSDLKAGCEQLIQDVDPSGIPRHLQPFPTRLTVEEDSSESRDAESSLLDDMVPVQLCCRRIFDHDERCMIDEDREVDSPEDGFQ